MSFGNVVRLCRTQKGMSQGDLAELANLSPEYISLVERGKRDLRFSKVIAISAALNVPLTILMFLAGGREELEQIDLELAEKLSLVALKLISE